MKKQLIWFLPTIVLFLAILALSTILSVPVQVPGVNHIDKFQHVFAYLMLSLSFLIAFYKNNLASPRRIFISIALLSVYGFFLEYLQYAYFPNRYFEWLDAIANITGCLLAVPLFKWLYRV